MATSESAANWWRRPLRAVHTVLREPDAADYDLAGVLEWLRRWRANVYAVNGGGLCAFYQTEVPLHRKNRFLNGRDLFTEIVPWDDHEREAHSPGQRLGLAVGMHEHVFEVDRVRRQRRAVVGPGDGQQVAQHARKARYRRQPGHRADRLRRHPSAGRASVRNTAG